MAASYALTMGASGDDRLSSLPSPGRTAVASDSILNRQNGDNTMTYTIASMGGRNYLEEQCHSDAMECICLSMSRESTRAYLLDNFPEIDGPELTEIMDGAYADAVSLGAGVPREDFDPSWEDD